MFYCLIFSLNEMLLEALDLHLHNVVSSHCLHCHYYLLSFVPKPNYPALHFYFILLSFSFSNECYLISDNMRQSTAKAFRCTVFKCTFKCTILKDMTTLVYTGRNVD